MPLRALEARATGRRVGHARVRGRRRRHARARDGAVAVPLAARAHAARARRDARDLVRAAGPHSACRRGCFVAAYAVAYAWLLRAAHAAGPARARPRAPARRAAVPDRLVRALAARARGAATTTDARRDHARALRVPAAAAHPGSETTRAASASARRAPGATRAFAVRPRGPAPRSARAAPRLGRAAGAHARAPRDRPGERAAPTRRR